MPELQRAGIGGSDISHLRQEPGTQGVSCDPGVKQVVAANIWFLLGPVQELLQDRTAIALSSFKHGSEQNAAGLDEELSPQLAGFFQSFGAKRLALEARAGQRFGGLFYRIADFRATGVRPSPSK